MLPAICISGKFNILPFFDSKTLAERQERISCTSENDRCVQVPLYREDGEDPTIAVSEWHGGAVVYDVATMSPKVRFRTESFGGMGLTCIRSNLLVSDPQVIFGLTKIHVFNSRTGKRVQELPRDRGVTYRILSVPQWSENEIFLAGLTYQRSPVYRFGNLFHHDLVRNVRVGSFVGHGGQDPTSGVWGIGADEERNFLISASQDRTMRLWDRRTYQCQGTHALRHRGTSLKYAKDRNLVCVGILGCVEIWDVRRPFERVQMIRLKHGGGGAVNDIDRIDETSFVSGSGGGDLSIWNTAGKTLMSTNVNLGEVYAGGALIHGTMVVRFNEEQFDLETDVERDLERIWYLREIPSVWRVIITIRTESSQKILELSWWAWMGV